MSDVTRRTLALREGSKERIDAIKLARGLKSDAAAINEAVEFRAHFVDRATSEIQEALAVYDAARSHTDRGLGMYFLDGPPSDNVKGIQMVMSAFGGSGRANRTR